MAPTPRLEALRRRRHSVLWVLATIFLSSAVAAQTADSSPRKPSWKLSLPERLAERLNPEAIKARAAAESAQQREWNHDRSLDWHLLEKPKHAGIHSLIRDLNRLYRDLPALHELDCDQAGFEWVVTEDAPRNVFAWIRKGNGARARCLVVANFSPNVYHNYRVRVPFAGKWREVLNSDSAHYGGSNVGNVGEVQTSEGLVPELSLSLPPLAAIFLVPES